MDKFLNVIDDYLLKYAYYRELVAGAKYLDLNYDSLNIGDIITYEIDTNNKYDNNAVKLMHNNTQIGFVHKNYIQEMILSYSKRKDYKIEITLNKIDIEKEQLGFQIAFYQKYNTKSFNILNRFNIECDSIPNQIYNLRKNKKTNQYYIEENNYIFKSEMSKKLKNYLDNNAFILLRGKIDNIIEVLVVI